MLSHFGLEGNQWTWSVALHSSCSDITVGENISALYNSILSFKEPYKNLFFLSKGITCYNFSQVFAQLFFLEHPKVYIVTGSSFQICCIFKNIQCILHGKCLVFLWSMQVLHVSNNLLFIFLTWYSFALKLKYEKRGEARILILLA